jgi:hypothetical protein
MIHEQYEIWKHRQIVKESSQGSYSLCKYISAIDALEFTKHDSMKEIFAITPCYETSVASMFHTPNEK